MKIRLPELQKQLDRILEALKTHYDNNNTTAQFSLFLMLESVSDEECLRWSELLISREADAVQIVPVCSGGKE